MKNIYLVEQILEKDHIRAVTYFHNLGLGSENIVKIWEICDAILKSGKYEGNIYDFYSVDIKEILTAMRVMVVSIGSRGSHIPAMTPRRLRRGVIAGM